MVGRGRRDAAEVGLFGAELSAARVAAGLTQDELGERVHFSGSMIGMVETGRRAATLELAEALDGTLGTPGTFQRLYRYVRLLPLPAWFQQWAEIEATATQLRLFEHSLVPGLLQTEGYARAVLSTRPDVTDKEVSDLVATRMERQAVLARERPPRLWVVLDEMALRREIGSAQIMREQLLHLVAMSGRPGVTVEVVPASAGAHSGLLGACAIAEADGRPSAAYLETLAEGFVVETPSAVGQIILTFDSLRAEAMPRGASRDIIAREAEKWT